MTASFFLLNTRCRNNRGKCNYFQLCNSSDYQQLSQPLNIIVQNLYTRILFKQQENSQTKKSQTFPHREPNYHEGIDYLCSGRSSAQLLQIQLVDDNGQLWGGNTIVKIIHDNSNILSSNASQNIWYFVFTNKSIIATMVLILMVLAI